MTVSFCRGRIGAGKWHVRELEKILLRKTFAAEIVGLPRSLERSWNYAYRME